MTIYIIIIAIALIIPTAYGAIIGAPFVLVPKKDLKKIFEMADLKNGQIFYDLGSGTGRTIIEADWKFGALAIGFEISPILYLLSLINTALRCSKAKTHLKNFFKEDLSNADVIFCFLMPHSMEKLSSKFTQELKPETKIISYAFEIKNWQPKETRRAENNLPIYLYSIKPENN